MIFAFVILHYHIDSLKFTYSCIDSFSRQAKDNYDEIHILVIDNNSKDESSEHIKRKIKGKYSVLKINDNIGFSFAVKKSIEYFKNKGIYPDFFISLNNDTKLLDSNFIQGIKKSYEDYKFDILGPNITNIMGENQNPYPSIVKTNDKDWLNKY